MNSKALLAALAALHAGACATDRDGTSGGLTATGPTSGSGGGSGGDSDSEDSGASDGSGGSGGSGDPGGSGGPSSGGGDGDGDGDGDSGGGIRLDVGNATDAGSGVGGEGGGGDGCENISVLFVVDISGSMSEERSNLAANFPDFVSVLDAYVADPGNNARGYRLGVTNSSIVNNASGVSDMGLDGKLYAGGIAIPLFGGCADTFSPPWIDGPGGSVSADFTCLASYPIAGAGSDVGAERPLDAIEYFIDHSTAGGANEGFYDPANSLFVVVNLTDEDDTRPDSTTTPAQTKARLDAFARGPDRYVAVTIAGPQAGGCTSAFGDAIPAPILHEFTNGVDNGLMGDICQGDLSTALSDALELIQISCDELPPPVG